MLLTENFAFFSLPHSINILLCQGFSRLQKLGLCVGKGTVNKKLQEASCEFDSKVKAWMAAIEKKKARGFALIFYSCMVSICSISFARIININFHLDY